MREMVSDIPIVGRTRAWVDIKFGVQPVVKKPMLHVEGVQPEVVGWQLGFLAIRSDGLPFQSASIIDAAKVNTLTDPVGAALQQVRVLVQNLETYRTCACNETAPCALHQQAIPGRPQ